MYLFYCIVFWILKYVEQVLGIWKKFRIKEPLVAGNLENVRIKELIVLEISKFWNNLWVLWKTWPKPGSFLGGYLTFSNKKIKLVTCDNQIFHCLITMIVKTGYLLVLYLWLWTLIPGEDLVQFLIPTSLWFKPMLDNYWLLGRPSGSGSPGLELAVNCWLLSG